MARQPGPWTRRDGGAWYAWVRGKQVRLAESGRPKAEAWEALRRLQAEGDGEREVPAASLTAVEVFNLWIVSVERAIEGEGASGASLRRYLQFLDSASEAFGRVAARALRPHDVQDWIDARATWNATTRHHAIGTVKTAFAWARRSGILDSDPIGQMRRPSAARRRAIMTAEQLASFIAAIPDEPFRDMVIALRETGARPNEVITLTADRVDLRARRWRVINKTRRKTGEPTRPVYLSAAAVEMSRRLVVAHPEGLVFRNGRGTPWTNVTLARRFERLRVRLGMGEECCAYALRHLFITDALEKGVPPATVAELVGHADLKMIMAVYNQLRQRTGHLIDAVESIRPGE